MERIRRESGDAGAQLLDLENRFVVLDPGPAGKEYVELDPVVIISFGRLCLVRVADETGWFMGQLDQDGSIICWGEYGDDLGEAIQAL